MKILCISDYKDPLIYSNRIKERFGHIDLILSAGDLDLDYYSFIISNLDKTLVFVFGNHNLKDISYYKSEYRKIGNYGINQCFDDSGCGAVYIGGKVKNIDDLIIAGLGGSMKYNNGKNQYTEIGMFFYMMRIIPKLLFNRIFHGRYLDILLTHAPPRGIHDKRDLCHTGFKVFLWFMNVFKPKYLIHGHVHLYDRNKKRVTKYKDTLVINAYNHVIIDTEEING